jgi:chemotaxis protein methyltransferase CheR
MPSLPLSPPVFAILSAIIEERIGLHYALAEQDLLADKISPRAQEAGFDSLLDYYYFLRYDPRGREEMEALTEALVVNETYFFREFDQLRVLVDEVVAPKVAAGRRVRIWSAACATGEEPVTVAMLLADAGLLPQVDIVASDISQRALARAKDGMFGRRALRNVPKPHLVERYLMDGAGGIRVHPDIAQAIRYSRVNLLDDQAVAGLGVFDVILCRNVLIYFRDETVRRLLERLARALAPDGTLFVGVSESLLRFGTSLVCEEKSGVFVYRRPG